MASPGPSSTLQRGYVIGNTTLGDNDNAGSWHEGGQGSVVLDTLSVTPRDGCQIGSSSTVSESMPWAGTHIERRGHVTAVWTSRLCGVDAPGCSNRIVAGTQTSLCPSVRGVRFDHAWKPIPSTERISLTVEESTVV